MGREYHLLDGGDMKILKALLATIAISAASMTSASAHDSFHLGINLGGYGYAPPPVAYYPAPAYYGAPTVYYAQPRVIQYGPPVVSYRYYNGGGYRGWHHGNRGRDDWDRGRGNWDRGDRGHGDGHRGRGRD